MPASQTLQHGRPVSGRRITICQLEELCESVLCRFSGSGGVSVFAISVEAGAVGRGPRGDRQGSGAS